MEAIYTLSTMQDEARNLRCWGWFNTLEEATDAILNNSGDLHECYYSLAVIERVKPDMSFGHRPEYWFRWDNDKLKAWVPCEKPETLKNVICFGVG